MDDLDSILESLWFGDTDPTDLEQRAAASRAADVARRGLRPFPASVARVASVVRQPQADAARIEEALSGDPVIASRVLALANSSQFGGGAPLSSLRHAVARLGGRTVYEMVVQVALQTVYQGLGGGDAVIEHSSATARAVQLLQLVHPKPHAFLYLAALLHDVGRLLLIQSGEAIEGDDGDAHAAAERAALGFDHGLLGAVAVTTWGLPDPLPAIIGAHHEVARAFETGGEVADGVACLRVAEDLLDMATHEIDDGHALMPWTTRSHWSWLGLDHRDAYDLLDLWHQRGQLEGSVDWKDKIREARRRRARRGGSVLRTG